MDDNGVNARIMLAQLTEIGLRSASVSSGVEALARTETERFDAILMDCFMPELDGYETTRRIRARGEEPRVPIIAVTANAIVGARARCIEAGMDDFLAKPFSAAALREVLARHLTLMETPTTPTPTTTSAPTIEIESESIEMLARLGVLPRVAKLYLDGLDKQIAAIRAAADDGDLTALRSAAHRLRGASAQLGISEFARLCGVLESAAAAGELEASRAAAADVFARVDPVKDAVDALQRPDR
ncbi:MAG: response regulator [Myxococcales bacterium]|nr:response regulator [Myxococcales bacterium]